MVDENKTVQTEVLALVSDLIKNLTGEVKTLSIDSARMQVQTAEYVRRLESIEKLIESGSDGMHLLEAIKSIKDELDDCSTFRQSAEDIEQREKEFEQKKHLVDREQRWKFIMTILMAIMSFISGAVIVWLKLKTGTP